MRKMAISRQKQLRKVCSRLELRETRRYGGSVPQLGNSAEQLVRDLPIHGRTVCRDILSECFESNIATLVCAEDTEANLTQSASGSESDSRQRSTSWRCGRSASLLWARPCPSHRPDDQILKTLRSDPRTPTSPGTSPRDTASNSLWPISTSFSNLSAICDDDLNVSPL